MVGLDLSLTGTGVAILRRSPEGEWAVPELCTIRPIHAPKGPISRQYEGARLHDVVTKIVGRGILDGSALVAMEDYAYGIAFDKTNCTFQLGELGGCIRYLLFHAGIPYMPVPISVGKKFATGSGAAKKDLVAARMADLWGLPGFTEKEFDASDALSLASIAAYKVFDGLPGLKEYRFQRGLVGPLEIVDARQDCQR